MTEPWLADPDVTLYHGDCLEVLRELPSGSVHMCATSPPFYGLRDYGTEGQIGLEETPDQWVERLVQVFREVRRVLRDDATCWIELGDSFANKQLVGQPWQLAFALQRDGWFLRSEIIWSRLRPNPMPEAVTDRPTKSHSTIFLLAKQPRYFYDADAIREPASPNTHSRGNGTSPKNELEAEQTGRHKGWGASTTAVLATANARSVWQQATEPTPYAHFATWPQALVRRMILAGTSERGCCPECGAAWVRRTEVDPAYAAGVAYANERRREGYRASGRAGMVNENAGDLGPGAPRTKINITLGWDTSCDHALAPVPCTVLDPFAGSGTTNLVARNHGRHSIGIELNEQYLEIAAKRLQQLSLLA